MQSDSSRQAGVQCSEPLWNSEAARAAMGQQQFVGAIEMISAWEDNDEMAWELAYRLWILFKGAPLDSTGRS